MSGNFFEASGPNVSFLLSEAEEDTPTWTLSKAGLLLHSFVSVVVVVVSVFFSAEAVANSKVLSSFLAAAVVPFSLIAVGAGILSSFLAVVVAVVAAAVLLCAEAVVGYTLAVFFSSKISADAVILSPFKTVVPAAVVVAAAVAAAAAVSFSVEALVTFSSAVAVVEENPFISVFCFKVDFTSVAPIVVSVVGVVVILLSSGFECSFSI